MIGVAAYNDSQYVLFDATALRRRYFFTGKLVRAISKFITELKTKTPHTCWNVTMGPGCGSHAMRSRIQGTCPKTDQWKMINITQEK
jgi:hypothetical protein